MKSDLQIAQEAKLKPITEKAPKGMVHVCFGCWNSIHKVNVNLLIGEYVSDIKQGTAFHNCLVDIQCSLLYS